MKSRKTTISRFKPGVARRTHLLLAAMLWTGVGTLLLTKGAFRLTRVTDYQGAIVAASLLAGTLKGYFVLDRSARRTINRIAGFNDNTCFGAVYSIKTWVLVVGMIAMGIALRRSSLPPELLSFIYITIGWGLLFSSRLAWFAWRKGTDYV
ncbi:hypothetical protein DGMP_08490 [Desulfomarina profundi]|uniref:Uncharacterized protein n=1 Tax=Desulfomarina profundi TaxID=2772557 RepID=A0A8D5JQL3_9BACT|nr:hypothetical protein [Desulfomarina profundi]BCL60156.1 hypothetical protein DGMP_08490 [Desulfomarina profundi]